MTDPERTSKAVELIGSMGWEAMPYGCVGMSRPKKISESRTVWSWLVLVPWAVNDTKPWIDGTELIDRPMSAAAQKDHVLGVMREALDTRYGETYGSRAVDDFLREIQGED